MAKVVVFQSLAHIGRRLPTGSTGSSDDADKLACIAAVLRDAFGRVSDTDLFADLLDRLAAVERRDAA